MITTARQLKDLIRNLSKKKSADAQILMRNYMMERFLEGTLSGRCSGSEECSLWKRFSQRAGRL